MKPLNLDNSPCSPTSSNCVIWQGPDLACIKLCKGDTVSDVIAALATELCTILDQLNVNNYDLSCFASTACPPADFQALIQFLIDQICEAQGITVDPTRTTSACPDCVVTVAACFIVGNTTTMQLVDYVNLIAERVCSIIDQISLINNQISILDSRVTVLENTPPPTFTLPSISTGCLAPYMASLASAPIDQVLSTLLNNSTIGYCALIQATGLPAAILSAVASQCIASTDTSLAYSPDTMGTAYFGSWVNSPVTAANAITNLWISICDIRNYLLNLSFSVVDTNTVNLIYTGSVLSAEVQDTGWVRLNGFSYIPDTNSSLPMVRRIGNVLHFRGTIIVPLANGAAPLTWNSSSGVDSYFLQTTVAPFQGVGGVLVSPFGSITFNNNGAGSCDSVIPLSVIPVGWAIDGSYENPAGWKVACRVIPISTDDSTVLTTVVTQTIEPNGNLSLTLLRDLEATGIPGRGGPGSFDTAHLNTIISHVSISQFPPKYSNGGTTLYDNNLAGTQPTSIFYATAAYGVTVNANNPDQLGGFFQILDGLTAFISPCSNLLPTPVPCP
jgi:hypothetical protein